MSRVLNIVYSLLEAGPEESGPDDLDPKAELMNTEPDADVWLAANGFRPDEAYTYRKTYSNGWATVRFTSAEATPFEVVLNFRAGGKQYYGSLTFDELKMRLRQRGVVTESEDPDAIDPKAEMMKVDPTADIRRIIGRFKRQDLDVHSWSRAGDILKIKALPVDTGMEEAEVEAGVAAELQRMGFTVDPAAVTVSRTEDGWFLIMFPLTGMPARSHKRRLPESDPDAVDPKSELLSLPNRRELYSQIKPADGRGTAALQIVLRQSLRDGEWVTRVKNAETGGESWGNYFMDYDKAVADYEERCRKYDVDPTPLTEKPVFEGGPDDVNPRDALLGLPEPILIELRVYVSDGYVVTNERSVIVDGNDLLRSWSANKLLNYYTYAEQHKRRQENFMLKFMGDSQGAIKMFSRWPNTGELIDMLQNQDGSAEMVFNSEALINWINKNRPDIFQSVDESGPDDVNPIDYLKGLKPRDPRITITFSRTTPESSAEGDFSESGWIDEEGVSMWPDHIDQEEGLSVVDLAVKFLQKEGAVHPSSSDFHPGVWWSTEWSTVDYSTGEDEERNYHLHEFTPEEEREIWIQLRGPQRAGR